MSKFRGIVEGLKAPVKKVGEKVSPFKALQKEAKLGPELHADVLAALKQVQSKNPELKKVLDESAGFAVVPAIGRVSAMLPRQRTSISGEAPKIVPSRVSR